MIPLSLSSLREAARRDAALVWRCRLQPAGGRGDKVFPPTYEGGEYAWEERIIDGKRVQCVLLDSVQSQANRMELALLDAHRRGDISIPVITVDFASAGLPEVGTVSSLEAPHRLADAILRDSFLRGVRFRDTEYGKALDEASLANATPLFEVCPTALVFGIWDSTGPRGGLGAKFARALVSEIVAVDAVSGVKPSSRIDPLGIQKFEAYRTRDGSWTIDPERAVKDKHGKPIKVKPSEVNHGNVTPSLRDEKTKEFNPGGVTFDYALHTAVLSLSALRKLHFPRNGQADPARDEAGRTVLAALAVYALYESVERDGFLRSRCHLVPESESACTATFVRANGKREEFSTDAQQAREVLEAALDFAAKEAGLEWQVDDIVLEPRAELVELARKSRTSGAAREES